MTGQVQLTSDRGLILAWMTTVAQNRLTDAYRRARRRPRTQSLDAADEGRRSLHEVVPDQTDVVKDVVGRDVLRQVWRVADRVFLEYEAPNRCSPKQQLIAIRAVFFDGESPEAALEPLRIKLGWDRQTAVAQSLTLICDLAAHRRLVVCETLLWSRRVGEPREGEAPVLHTLVAACGCQVVSTLVTRWPASCCKRSLKGTDLCTPFAARYLALRLSLTGLKHDDVCKAVEKIGGEAGLPQCSWSAVNNWIGYSAGTSAWKKLVEGLLRDPVSAALLRNLVETILREQAPAISEELKLKEKGVSVARLRELLMRYYRGEDVGDELEIVEAAHRLLVQRITSRFGEVIGKRSDAGTRKRSHDQ